MKSSHNCYCANLSLGSTIIILLIVTFMAICFTMGFGSAVECNADCNAIKTFDSVIDRAINITCKLPSDANYGSVSTENTPSSCVSTSLPMYGEIVDGLMWRYNNNMTSVLGYNDIYYHNQTLLNISSSIGDYFVKNTSWQSAGFVQSAFLSRSLGKAYLSSVNDFGSQYELISYVDSLTEDSTIEISGNGASRDDAIFQNFTIDTITNLNSAKLIIDCGHLGADEEWNITINSKSYSFMILSICKTGLTAPYGYNGDLNLNISDLIVGVNNFTLFESTIEINDGNNTRFGVDLSKNLTYMFTDWDGVGFVGMIPENKTIQAHLELIYNNSNEYNSTGYWASVIRQWAFTQVEDTTSLNANHFVANQKMNQFEGLTIFSNISGINYFNDYVNTMFSLNIHNVDGVWEEWSELYASGTGGSNYYIPRGFSAQYQGESMNSLANIYYYSTNQTLKNIVLNTINNTFNVSSYFMLMLNSSFNFREKSIDNRLSPGSAYNWGFLNLTSFSGANIPDFFNSANLFSPYNSQAESIANLSNSYFRVPSDTSGNSDLYLMHAANYWIDYYKFYNANAKYNNNLVNLNSGRNYVVFNNSGLINILTNNYLTHLSYRGTVPNGGVISSIMNRNSQLALFSVATGNSALPLGFGQLTDNNGFFNGYDNNSVFIQISSVYPYKIGFSGYLTNKSIVNNSIFYNTTYTFYDDYIEVNQTSSSSTELQLWSISSQSLGSGIIPLKTIYGLKQNNVSIIPLNFNLSYQDTNEVSAWGIVDKFNATGTSFNYVVQINGNNAIPFKDSIDYKLFNNTFGYSINVINPLLTSALLTNGTSLCNGSSANLQDNTGQVNITLAPNDFCYVLDDFNLTDTMIPGSPGNPFTISRSGYSFVINSALDQTITNVPASADLDSFGDSRITCIHLKSITGVNSYNCDTSTNILTANADFNPGNNYFSLEFAQLDQGICGSALGAFASYPVLAGLIGIVFLIGLVIMFVGGYLVFKSQVEITNTQVAMFFVILAGIGILVIVGIVAIETICSVGVVS